MLKSWLSDKKFHPTFTDHLLYVQRDVGSFDHHVQSPINLFSGVEWNLLLIENKPVFHPRSLLLSHVQ